ncbi:MAG: tetratricopeptide repeat protein, partial [Gammaproteobacteria bacterium]
MNKHSLLFAPLLAICLHLPTVVAQNASPVPRMDSLIGAGQFQEAYELGQENLEEFEGIARFDFMYGLAALEAGEPNEAVFALERVAATSTDAVLRQRARLELARAYFVTNNLTASENLFNQVLATNPPPNVQQNIQAFLQLIESRRASQRSSFNWTIASVLGSDGNINSATSNGLIDTPLIGEIELNPDGQQTDDTYSNTTMTMVYNYPLTRDRVITATVNAGHLDNFSTDQFDLDNVRGEVAFNWGNQTDRFKTGVTAGKVFLSGNGFQDSTGLNASWQRNIGNGWYSTAVSSYSRLRYDSDAGGAQANLRDVNQFLLTGGVTKIAGLFTHTVNLYRADESPQFQAGKHNGREFIGLAYSLLWRLNAQHTPYLRASFQDVEHDANHPVFFNTVREDDNQTVSVGWFWQAQNRLQVTAETSYTDNASNIPLFDYSR